jgi:hypothetical protein
MELNNNTCNKWKKIIKSEYQKPYFPKIREQIKKDRDA